ncbi:ATP-binding protein [Desulfopila inferna]|uniref:ATP-binding protein n=1 Tax=Desulfopila inferna TaxID=468528 RepID=UPI001964E7AE|nr:ATP-binding protein [Desulfopila inferna]MBM9606735.1 ATP-binding protein [Desulfopila inferna]
MAERKVSLVETGQAIESLRNSDFDTVSAVGEVLDNSIQAKARNVSIVTKERELPARGRRKKGKKEILEIAFCDDGEGMDTETLHHCMQLGFSSRYNDRSGIGRFGVGMTLAVINQCKKIEVYSRANGDSPWCYTYVDLDKNNSDIPEPQEVDLPAEYDGVVNSGSGTIVAWSKCDRLNGTSEEIYRWVARTYRKFIGTHKVEKGKIVANNTPVTIKLNGKDIVPFDPLFAVAHADFPEKKVAEIFEPITIEMDVPEDAGGKGETSEITITMTLTPKEWRMKGGGESGRDPWAKENLTENEGFSVLRAGREVFYDVMPRFKPRTHADGLDRWWSAEICFDPVLDNYFSVKNIKRGARFFPQLREKIQERMGPTISECRKRVKNRWDQTKTEEQAGSPSTSNEHKDAEEAVKNAKTPSSQKKEKKTPKEEKKEIKDVLKKIVDESALDEWLAKIEKQPCTIIDKDDSSWKGSTFVDIHPAGGRTVIEYNRSHDIFIFIYDAIKELSESSPDTDSGSIVKRAKDLKVAIDLLMMAYAQAENYFGDLDEEQRIGDTLEFLRNNWGQYLRQYVKAYIKENGI